MMDNDPFETPATARPPKPRFILRYGPIFWRVFLVGFVVMEVVFWRKFVQPNFPFRPRFRRLLVMAYFSPRFLLHALMLAAVVTVVCDLIFRLVVRPLMRGWYHPRCLDPTAAHPLPFRLGVGETILEEIPGRRLVGRAKQPGTIVRTNRSLYFFPFAWDLDEWSCPIDHIARARLSTPRRRVLGWVRGYPDHLVLDEDSGESVTLILADPEHALRWFPRAVVEDAAEWDHTVPLANPSVPAENVHHV